jgi:hypothetical protein
MDKIAQATILMVSLEVRELNSEEEEAIDK